MPQLQRLPPYPDFDAKYCPAHHTSLIILRIQDMSWSVHDASSLRDHRIQIDRRGTLQMDAWS